MDCTVRTSDGKRFKVSKAEAAKFGKIKRMSEDQVSVSSDSGGDICLPAVVDRKAFRAAQRWAAKHSVAATSSAELKKWDSELLHNMDLDSIYRLLIAADFLDAPELVDLLAEKIASKIRGKTYVQIREDFNIVDDFAPGKLEAFINKNPWAFE